ncbi:SRPBCC family protein [Paenibacillus elgii]|uniref:SRPBCC family protein n=1 Tax=Paenibacillus elgii TaxID=189691 RepID=UPI0013D8CD79|nr:SRPBCC family protein [Paenibacillus elgii]
MLASIQQVDGGYTARFERHLKHPVDQVWSVLTDNDRLAEWFPQLRIDELREGGLIKFDMQDGTFKELKITDLAMHSVLGYTWGEDRVRFELYPEPEGCLLVLVEQLHKITGHTSKDLAGWHVCLDVIDALLSGRATGFRKEEWETWHEQYVRILTPLGSADE